jgi:hypothetical protein
MAYEITPVSQQIKPVSNLSLADMVNIGRGVQSYKSGQIALEQQDVGNLEQRAIAEAVKADPGLFMTDNSLDIEKAKRILPQLAPRTYPAMLEKYTTMSKAEVEAKSAKQNLTQDQKNLVGQTFNILGKAGIKDKNTYLGALDDLVKTNPNNPDLGRLVDSYKTIWNELPEQTPWDQLAQRGAQTLLNIFPTGNRIPSAAWHDWNWRCHVSDRHHAFRCWFATPSGSWPNAFGCRANGAWWSIRIDRQSGHEQQSYLFCA